VSVLERPSDRQRGPGRDRRRYLRLAALGLLLAAVFVVGVAFGQALDDGPQQGGTVTTVRTLTPRPQDPPLRTVTVTVTQP
jgi:hypothetical protein